MVEIKYRRNNLPVTPAMVRGCAPRTENTKAAMNEDRRTSETPYCWVVSIKSNEKAIPGRTLAVCLSQEHKRKKVNVHFAKKIRAVAGTTR